MSLQSLLDLSSSRDTMKQGVSEERLKENMDMLREQIAFFRAYPDLFIDYEITKGKMDDVFLSITGKALEGGNK